ncbi:MAG: hypothetical protein ABFD79_18755 [Phycisphaerales bacterium]
MKEIPGGEIEFVPLKKSASPDSQIRGLLGISLKDFIDKVKCNKNGEYDFLYEEPAIRKCV